MYVILVCILIWPPLCFDRYDVLHFGHVRILKRAAAMKGPGGTLCVGVSSDALNFSKKQRYPVYNQKDRMAIVEEVKASLNAAA